MRPLCCRGQCFDADGGIHGNGRVGGEAKFIQIGGKIWVKSLNAHRTLEWGKEGELQSSTLGEMFVDGMPQHKLEVQSHELFSH